MKIDIIQYCRTHQLITRSDIEFFQALSARYKLHPLKIDLLLGSTVVLVILMSSMLTSFYKTEDVKQDTSHTTSGAAIEDLQGATIQVWKPWQLSDGSELTISIVNSKLVSQDKIAAIKDAILSEATIKSDDPQLSDGLIGSTHSYFKGWKGALESASASKFYIPTKFVFIESSRGPADITIELTSLESSDGYSGYTKPIVVGDHILQTDITIYKADQYSADRLESIVRHEFGHALGLGHSTDSEDLMYPLIDTDYPYVSQCDIEAIHSLYDGKDSGKVVCDKQ